jgi:hypothetical protein
MAGAAQIAAAYGIDPTLAAKIEQVAYQVGIPDPAWLANLINFESNGFNPQAVNPFSGATGLIQFMPRTARELGTTTDALRAMPAVRQMDYVRAYFQLPRVREKGPLRTPLDVYMAVFYPDAIGQGPLYVFPAAVQVANPGIVTPGAYAAKVEARAKLSSAATAIMGQGGAVVAQAGGTLARWGLPLLAGTLAGLALLAGLAFFRGRRRRRL